MTTASSATSIREPQTHLVVRLPPLFIERWANCLYDGNPSVAMTQEPILWRYLYPQKNYIRPMFKGISAHKRWPNIYDGHSTYTFYPEDLPLIPWSWDLPFPGPHWSGPTSCHLCQGFLNLGHCTAYVWAWRIIPSWMHWLSLAICKQYNHGFGGTWTQDWIWFLVELWIDLINCDCHYTTHESLWIYWWNLATLHMDRG